MKPARSRSPFPPTTGSASSRFCKKAAAAEGLTLPTPNAVLGSVEALRAAAAELGLVVRARTEAAYDEGPLSGDPNTVVDNYLGLGHAEPLRVAPSERRNAVIDRFVTGFEHRRGTTSQHVVVFARLGPRHRSHELRPSEPRPWLIASGAFQLRRGPRLP